MASATVTAKDLATWRSNRLGLTGPPATSAEAVVGWLTAVQSQDFLPAKWSISMRAAGTSNAQLDALFNDGAILRTHVLRPTWHFVLPEDIRWLLAATGPRVQRINASRYRELGLDERTLEQSSEVVAKAIADEGHLTRRALGEALTRAGIATDGQRLAYMVMNAELTALICSGRLAGKQHTYALLADRASSARVLDADEALAELTRRYIASHGPATVKDFAAWSSLTQAEIARGIDMAGDDLSPLEVDGLRYWYRHDPPPFEAGPGVRLLQLYDEYVMGYRESRFLMNRDGLAPGARPSLNGIVVERTQAIGWWKRLQERGTTVVLVHLAKSLSRRGQAALATEVGRFGDFLGTTAELRLA
jgi:hypothetical protein